MKKLLDKMGNILPSVWALFLFILITAALAFIAALLTWGIISIWGLIL